MEVQGDLEKTREELQHVMSSPVVATPMAAPMARAMIEEPLENDHDDHEENNSTCSAELQVEGFEDHRIEEERITEAEKNERMQKQLMVISRFLKHKYRLLARIVIQPNHSSNSESEKHLKHIQIHSLIRSGTTSGGSAVFENYDLFSNSFKRFV